MKTPKQEGVISPKSETPWTTAMNAFLRSGGFDPVRLPTDLIAVERSKESSSGSGAPVEPNATEFKTPQKQNGISGIKNTKTARKTVRFLKSAKKEEGESFFHQIESMLEQGKTVDAIWGEKGVELEVLGFDRDDLQNIADEIKDYTKLLEQTMKFELSDWTSPVSSPEGSGANTPERRASWTEGLEKRSASRERSNSF